MTTRIPQHTFVMCGLLLAAFAAISWSAVSKKSSTFDEPIHVLASWMVVHANDFRIDPENPPLWQHWAALDQPSDALRIDAADPQWRGILHDNQVLRFDYCVKVLYHTPGNDGERFVRRSRAMMLIVGIALGAMIAGWGWRIGGSTAAIVATCLYCFDPNFLGHAPLVKNDVTFAAAFVWFALASWLIGLRITPLRIANLSLALAATLLTKFTGLIAPPILILLLLIRAAMPMPWPTIRKALRRPGERVLAVLGILVCAAPVNFLAIWACYHFRFDPTAEAGVSLERHTIVERAAAADEKLGISYHVAEWAERHRLLPQALLHGVMYQSIMADQRPAFLLGEYSATGWWYYFPLAMLFKTPVVTMGAMAAAAVVGVRALNRKRKVGGVGWAAACRFADQSTCQTAWLMACLFAPPMILFAASMLSGVNVGIRHVLVVYPFIYLMIGIVAAHAVGRNEKITRRWLIAGGFLLAIESLAAFPNYIAFFNFACGGTRNGINLLSDSNLDWGQDLPALARWQREHLNDPMFLFYFGVADPSAYGIRTTTNPSDASVLAISATVLQGPYDEDQATHQRMDWLRKHRTPLDVLNGTIYLYHFSPADQRQMEHDIQLPQP